MTALYLVDDPIARSFAPFTLTRPASELRAGAVLMRHRWERAFRAPATGILTAPHLATFEERYAPPAQHEMLPAGAILANSRCLIPLDYRERDADVWMCEGRIAAVRIGRTLKWDVFEREGLTLDHLRVHAARVAQVQGRWLDRVWDLIEGLPGQLADDIARLGPQLVCVQPPAGAVLGEHPVYLERGTTIEPHVILDATAGPILVRQGAAIRAFTRLVGPCAIDENTTILGDRVAGCSIGDGCLVRGEISDSIIVGNTNKAHDGFVGHSVLGRWVNLGAGTITSNLKNTYGTVSIHTPDGMRDTGLLKLGSLIGDHVKTGIGLRLTTGTVVGAGSNLYGSAMPPKVVPPFSWGEGSQLAAYDIEKFLVTADRAMGRRGLRLGPQAQKQLRGAHTIGRNGA